MFCSNCGSQLPEGANACPNCGEKVEKDINISGVVDYTNQKTKQIFNNIFGNVEEEKASRTMRDINEMFVNTDEQQKAVIGGGYLSNMLKTGILNNGFGILTNRRLYYRGKCFYKAGNHVLKTDEDCTVDLQDISSTGFTYTKRLWLLLIAVGVLVVSVGTFIAFDGESIIFPLISFLCGLALLMAYDYFTITTYNITFAGGNLSIRASDYNVKKVREFDKTLHQVKDEYLASRR